MDGRGRCLDNVFIERLWRSLKYARGGLLVPVREAFSWHQGLWLDGKAEKERRLELSEQWGKLSNLIPHATFRPASPLRGRAAERSRSVRLAARLAAELRPVRGPRQAWRFSKWLSRAVAWRAGRATGSFQRRIRVSYRAQRRPGRRVTG